MWTDPLLAFMSGAEYIGFRELNKNIGGAGRWEKVLHKNFWLTYDKWQAYKTKFIMDDSVPNDRVTLQGEITWTFRGLEGFLDTRCEFPMRPAIAAGHMRHCTYATVNALLDRFMDESSRDDLRMIFELFPDSTVEFACFSVNVGVFPNRRTIFWEIRNY